MKSSYDFLLPRVTAGPGLAGAAPGFGGCLGTAAAGENSSKSPRPVGTWEPRGHGAVLVRVCRAAPQGPAPGSCGAGAAVGTRGERGGAFAAGAREPAGVGALHELWLLHTDHILAVRVHPGAELGRASCIAAPMQRAQLCPALTRVVGTWPGCGYRCWGGAGAVSARAPIVSPARLASQPQCKRHRTPQHVPGSGHSSADRHHAPNTCSSPARCYTLTQCAQCACAHAPPL